MHHTDRMKDAMNKRRKSITMTVPSSSATVTNTGRDRVDSHSQSIVTNKATETDSETERRTI